MQVFANNAYSSLGASLSNSATSLTLATATGIRFPSPTGGSYFLLTLVGLDSNGNENAWEIVKVTGRASDALTIVRAQESTTAVAWAAGTRVELRATAGTFSSYATLAAPTFTGGLTVASGGASITGNTSVVGTLSTTGGITNTQTESVLALTSTAGSARNWQLVSGGGTLGAAGNFYLRNATSGAAPVIVDGAAANNTVYVGSTGLSVTGQISSTGNVALGDGTGAKYLSVNGAASGTTGGSYLVAQAGGSSTIAIGNASALLGGAYDGTAMLWAVGALKIHNNGSVNAILDASGNLTVGGTSANGYKLEVTGNSQAKNTIGQTYQGVGASAMWIDSAGAWSLGLDSANGATARLKVDSSGNLLLGDTSNAAGARLRVVGGNATNAVFNTTRASGAFIEYDLGASGTVIGYIGAGSQLATGVATNDLTLRAENNLVFASGASTERGRFDSSGNLLVGTTAASSFHRLVKNNPGDWAASIRNTSSSNPYGLTVNFEGVTGGAGQFFISCQDDTARFRVLGNGNVQNINNSYGAISDEKLKDILGPAASYWDKYKLVQFINYCLKADPDKLKLLGVSAQQLRTVFPGLIDENADYKEVTKTREVPAVLDAEGNEVKPAVTEEYIERVPTGTTTLSVKYSVLGTIADVVTQEAQLRIEALEAANAAILQRLAALEAA